MSKNRVGGTIFFRKNGIQYRVKGEWSYNLGVPKRTAVIGEDGSAHGYSEGAQVAFMEGAITDSKAISVEDLVSVDGDTVTLELANGKTILLPDAWYAGEGTGKTREGEIPVRFEAVKGQEV